MKEKFNLLDVRAMIKDLRSSVLGLRVVNVYDINPKLYFFKLAISGEQKVSLVMESGNRFHLTRFSKTKPGEKLPSTFAMKLRQCLNGKRLDLIRQLGNDRVVDFKFGFGSSACHVILEMYAQGNIILTDSTYKIITLLRIFVYSDGTPVRAGEYYPVSTAVSSSVSSCVDSVEKFQEWMLGAVVEEENRILLAKQTNDTENAEPETKAPAEKGKKSKKNEKNQKITLKSLLLSKSSPFSSIGPSLLDHCLISSNLSGSTQLASNQSNPLTRVQIEVLFRALTVDSLEILDGIDMIPQKGFIILTDESDVNDESTIVYDEFVPRILAQHATKKNFEFACFDDAVDYYFQKFDDQKVQKNSSRKKEDILTKVSRIEQDHSKRIQELDRLCQEIARKALVLEQHSDEVDKVSFVLAGALSHGLEWDDVEALVEDEKTKHNPIASLIDRIFFPKDLVRVRLRDLSDIGDDEGLEEYVLVDVNFKLTAFGNVRLLHEQRRRVEEKRERTMKSSIEAVDNAQRLADEQAGRIHVGPSAEQRKVFWFEKFHWFITSDNYLVISGRDAQQNEILVKRYMRTGDVYVHADIHGSASCIVRNKNASRPISPIALLEAGSMSVCRSAAWKSKIITSAWWVHASQVSKSAPSGEYLTVGSFMIRGRKNFLPPSQLEMGIGVMFRLEDSFIVKHKGERKDRGEVMSELSRVQIEVDDSQSADSAYIDVADPTIRPTPKTKKKKDGDKTADLPVPSAKDAESEKGDASDEESENQETVADSKKVKQSYTGPKRKTSKARKKKILKYKDQDDEERRLAMIALGHRPKKDDADELKKKEKDRIENEEKMKKAGVDVLTAGDLETSEIQTILSCMDPSIINLLARLPSIDIKKYDVFELRCLSRFRPDDAMVALRVLEQALQSDTKSQSGLLARIIQQVIECRLACKNQNETIDVDSIVRLLIEGESTEPAVPETVEVWNDVDSDGEMESEQIDEGEDMQELDKLTAMPVAGEINLFAVPVCAPYLSMRDFKYKFKLVPGGQKKGHASRSTMQLINASENDTNRAEVELMKSITENDMVAALIGDVRVVSTGMRFVTTKNKAKPAVQNDDDDEQDEPRQGSSNNSNKKKQIVFKKKTKKTKTPNELLMEGLSGTSKSSVQGFSKKTK